LAVGVAFLWGYLWINKVWLPNPATGVIHWLPYGVLALTFLSASKQLQQFDRIWTAFVVIGLTIAIGLKAGSSGSYPMLLASGVLLVVRWSFSSFGGVKNKFSGFDAFAIFGISAAASIVAFFEGGSSKTAQLAALLGVICGAGFLFKRTKDVSPNALGVLGATFWFLTILLHYFTYNFPLSAANFLLAMPLAGFAVLSFLSKRPTAARSIAFLSLILLAAIAIWLTKLAAPEPYY
ncbi:MAG: hypothetical protein AAF585_22885, partial [Verrucomicrobiota bacterium]